MVVAAVQPREAGVRILSAGVTLREGSHIVPASPAPRPHPQAPAVPCVSNPFSPLLREESPSQLKGDKRDNPSLGVSLPLCSTPSDPQEEME